MITPETLSRHELAGLHVRVAAAANPSLVGTEGTVVDETKRTLMIEADDGGRDSHDDVGDDRTRTTDSTDGTQAHTDPKDASGTSRVRQVPKNGTTFEFRLPGGDDPTYVTVEGDVLVARPARRTERSSDSPWR